MGKVVLITGTSTGLGLATAILLAKTGHTVYATMRNLDKRKALEDKAQLENIKLVVKQLDVSSSESIDRCIQEIIQVEGRIDVLINNAGIGFLRASEQTTEQELQHVTDVNYFGVVRCTNAVLPFMRHEKQGHILNVSSVGGLVGQPFNELYCAAKFAVEGYTEALASYLSPNFGILFTIVEPGGISTEFSNSVFKDFSATEKSPDDAYAPILEKYIGSMQSRPKAEVARIYQTPEQVAQVIADCLKRENPPLRTRTSDWSNEFAHLKTLGDPDGLKVLATLQKSYFG